MMAITIDVKIPAIFMLLGLSRAEFVGTAF